jgi:Ca2+-binding EF-hand superfamily protein
VDNSGFITAENLQEVFRRQGKMMTLHSVKEMIEDVEPAKEG